MIRRILEHLGVPADPLQIAPARDPTWVQAEQEFEPHDGDDFDCAPTSPTSPERAPCDGSRTPSR